MKVYELAKKLNINSKDIIAMASNVGINVKNHMSVLADTDVNKIEKLAKKSSKTEKVKSKKDNPVIVRRVISNEDTVEEDKTKQQKGKERKEVGFVERNQKKDFKIVYRNKQQKPPTVSELFGLDKDKSKKESKQVEKKETENQEENKTSKVVSKVASKETEKVQENKEDKKEEKEVKVIKSNAEKIDDKGAKNTDINSNDAKVEVKQDMRENRTESQDRKVNNRNSNNNNDRNNYNRNNYDRNNSDRNNYDRNNNRNSYDRNNSDRNSYDRNNSDRNNSDRNGYDRNNNNRNNNRNSSDNQNNRNFDRRNNRNFDNRDNRNFDNRDNRNFDNRDNRNFDNRDNRNSDNRDNRNFDNRDNRNFNNRRNNNNNNNRNFDNRNKKFDRNDNNNGYRNNKKGLDEKEIDKTIKNIMEIETVAEKEPARDYSKSIDKQRNNRINNSKYDESRSKNRKTRGNNEKFDEDKLKSLKQENKLSNMFNDQEGGMLDYYDLTTVRGKRNKKRNNNQANYEDRVKQKIFKLTDITIPETITVKDFAAEMKKTTAEVIKKLIGYGVLATINNDIDFDTASLIADEFGIKAHLKETVTDEDILFDDSEDDEKDLQSRPPVVVVMGHVDHGKTSLLDAVRQTNVIKGEAGGITQHIGAYKVKINNREITFLDTPGHEAFTSMRARGAQITDVAILVVAANDGVMPQTVEAINHAKAANIPIIVAVNKIDLPGANVERVKEQLTKYELVPEEWGGDTIYVPISAKEHTNIDTLLEMVLLVADMQDLKANPNKQSKGVVIEAKLDKSKGPVATMLVQRGTLDVGDTIVVGSVIGRIRAMTNDKGKKVKKAGPSTPVEVTGLTEVPSAGDTFYEVKDEKTAKHLIDQRKRQEREKSINATAKVSLNDLFDQIAKGKLKQLNLIVKADVQGSVEAVQQSLEKLSNDEVQVKVIHANVGAITESDVTLAKVSNAIIIGFNVRPNPIARDMASKDEVEIKLYSVIYQAIEDVQMAMVGMLDPEYEEKVIGTAVVRQTFKVSSVGTIAGCYVTDGKIQRNAGVRVIRDNVVLHDGKLVSLKRFKDDVKEVAKGFECGIQIENFNNIQEEDTIEVYVMEEIKRKLKDLKKGSNKDKEENKD